MKINSCCNIVVLCLFGGLAAARGAEIATLNGNTPIRVLLDREGRAGTVHSSSPSLYMRRESSPGWVQLPRDARVALTMGMRSSQLTVAGAPVNDSQVYFRGGPRSDDPFKFGDDWYRGALKVARHGESLVFSNVLSVEDYLMGTVASEMSPEWELEALKAQVVASRTYARYMMKNPRSPFYDVEKTVHDQVYGGIRAPAPRVAEAVLATAGEALEVKGEPIKAFFHSRCGGTTDTPLAVWNTREAEHQRSVPCPYCRNFPYTWHASVSLAEVFRIFRLPFTEGFHLFSSKKKGSPRVSSITLEAGGDKRTINSEKFRSVAGYSKIKSTMFDLRVTPGEVSFAGVGAGHGVGMCQWGARHLAKQGKTYREILAYYYPGALLSGGNRVIARAR